MRVLIATQTKDIHAKTVKYALEHKGHEAVLWYGTDLPTRQAASIAIAETGDADVRIHGCDIDMSDDFDVVWLRRATQSILPPDMHPGDREIAQRECTHFMSGLWRLLGERAFWVNPLRGHFEAANKPFQLQAAARSGLTIPPTLCSNDPDRIRQFLREQPGDVIYKPFNTTLWLLDEGVAYLFTSVVTADDLPDDDILRLSPGIFQPRLEKSHELRVTFIGDRPFAAALRSQKLTISQVDWRAGTRDIPIEPTTLPQPVVSACIQLMRRLGIVFGCFDFIVTPAQEYVFIEVNEMGQFLWIEEMSSDFLLLDAFCEFLIQGRRDFQWQPTASSVRFEQFRDDASEARNAAMDQRHVEHPYSYAADDGVHAKRDALALLG